jgi:hypothetical protein
MGYCRETHHPEVTLYEGGRSTQARLRWLELAAVHKAAKYAA